MTTKSRDKWLPALLLAAIVHVIVFAALYVNYANKNKSLESEVVTTEGPSTLPDAASQPPALVSETEIREIQVGESTAAQILEQQRANSTNEFGTDSGSSNEKVNAGNVVVGTTNDEGVKSTVGKAGEDTQLDGQANNKGTAKPTRQAAEIDRAQNTNAESDANSPSNPLSTQRPHAALLDMDMPSQGSSGKTALDKEYNKTKNEAEDLNAKMSSGINEIKNRNQKRIEETQAIQAYAHAVDNGRPSVALTSKPVAKGPSVENADSTSTKTPSNRLTMPTEE